MKSTHDDKSVKHWEKRQEAHWEKFQFNQPYAKGLERLREQVLDKTNFDPAVLWQWGTMQAMAIIEILKVLEQKLGREGQEVVFECLRRIGYDVGRQITEGTTITDDMSPVEWISFYATVINRIAYASLETTVIDDEDKTTFHIDWCPHQDHYQAFDCRVQRYFVQGMIDAGRDFANSQGQETVWDVAFTATIPTGSETCHFEVYRGDPEKARQWAEYTRLLEDKALKIATRESE